jgi:hypothetical protein
VGSSAGGFRGEEPEEIPALGLGTGHRGEDPNRRDDEIAALRLGLDWA